MLNLPTKVKTRLVDTLKRFQPILAKAKARDVNESDTVMIITDMLSELFGYDKYTEITSEFSIRGTFCDLAIKLNDKIEILIEVKAIGQDLKDAYAKQATDYAANQGVDWVVLTNGDLWRIFKIGFTKPILQELVCELNVTEINLRSDADLESLFLLTREGVSKNILNEYHTQRQALNRYALTALILSDPILLNLRRYLRKITDIFVDTNQIREVLIQDVLKRDVTEGERAEGAFKKIGRTISRMEKSKNTEENDADNTTQKKSDEAPIGAEH